MPADPVLTGRTQATHRTGLEQGLGANVSDL